MKYFKKFTLILIILICFICCIQINDVGFLKGGSITAPTEGSKYLYIANNTTPMYCTVSLIDGSLSLCQNTGNGITQALGVTAYKNYVYFVNRSGHEVYKCFVSSNGALVNCAANYTNPTFINDPKTLTVHNGYLYIGNFSTRLIVVCSISSTGDLTNCTQTASSNIVYNTFSIRANNSYFYMGYFSNQYISVCEIGSDGSLNSCTNNNLNNNYPYGLAFYGNYFYDVNPYSNNIQACSTFNAGVPSGCSLLTNALMTNPIDLAINKGTAYILNNYGVSIVTCSISNAILSNCSIAVNNLVSLGINNAEAEIFLATF